MAEYFEFKGTVLTTTGVADIYNPTNGVDGRLTNSSGASVILSALAANVTTGNVSVNLYTTLTGSTSTATGTVSTESGSFSMAEAIVVPANASLEMIVNKANVQFGSKLRARSSVASGIVFTVAAVDIQP
jgi:hypothetical protein